jgi:TPR repeat protein
MKLSVRSMAAGAITFVVAACTAVQAPITGRTQYMAVPEQTVVNTGAQNYAAEIGRYAKEGHLNADAAETARVKRLATRIVQQARTIRPEAASWSWNVSVANYTDVNAHCYPGGKIVVYSGLIRKLSLTDDELAAVMAHEVSHALAQHQREAISEKMTEQLILGILDVALVAASKGGQRYNPQMAANLSAQVSSLMFTLPYSRDREYEADRIGLTLMVRAGFDPHAMETVFQKMRANAFGGPSFLSTHPASSDRIAAIEAAINSDPELSGRQFAYASYVAPAVTPVRAPPAASVLPETSRYQVLKGSGPDDAKRFGAQGKAGDANALLALGLMELRGTGIPMDKLSAAKHIEDAATRGHPIAMNEVGNLYAVGVGIDRDDVKAISWYRKAEALGVVMAKTNLGLVYYLGRGVPVDQSKAASLLETPAAAGVPLAQRVLGVMYVEGKGVPKDVTKGWELLERAAAAKDKIAQGNLGFYLIKGQVVPRNVRDGVGYLEQAADNGHVVAMRMLGDIYAKGAGVPQDANKAVKYFERAGALNDSISLTSLGVLYIAGETVPDLPYGKLVPADPAKSFGYVKRAADMGNEAARYMVGIMYFRGLGVEKNDTLAEFNVRLSAERGYAQAQYIAGQAFAKGVVVDKDEDEGIRWFKLAAAQNHAKAKEELKKRGIDPAAASAIDGIRCKDTEGAEFIQPQGSCPAGSSPTLVQCKAGDGPEFEALSGHCPEGTSKIENRSRQ